MLLMRRAINRGHGRPRHYNRSRHGAASSSASANATPPAPSLLAKIQSDEVHPEQVRALDIMPDVADDLLLPGKAVSYLTNIVTVAERHFKNARGIDFQAEMIDMTWVGRLTINYPETRTFTCKNKVKKDSKNNCSLAAIYHLRKNNKIDSHLKVNIDSSVTTSFIDNARKPVLVPTISMSIKQQMMSFVSKFDEYIANLVDYQIDKSRENYKNIEIGGLEGKHVAMLEGLDPNDGESSGFESSSETSSVRLNNNSGVSDIFTGRIYRNPDARSRMNAFLNLKQVFSDKKRKYDRDDSYYDVIESQKRLPIMNLKEEVTEAIANNRVIVVAGDTGSGKSTQVPQFIMEDFIRRDTNERSFVNIAVTQPRRISAISLAERVAIELGEKSTGRTVGHIVRFDSKPPSRDLNIMSFFTTGMLLRKLQGNPDLQGVTHLIIDEVHERDCTIDFLLILIKRLLNRRRDLRVVLMSGSMDTELFSRYFDNCPIVSVSGRCFPVTNKYLDEICRDIRAPLPRELDNMSSYRTPKMDINLIVSLILHIDDTQRSGAILCFLPGWKEMKALQQELDSCTRTRSRLRVLMVHSKLPISEQRLIFSEPVEGERKIILATNIAETSITVNDVRYVIDTGICNSIDYDPELNMSTFGARWISKASAKQRCGRAGRTAPGDCYKLYTRREEASFVEFPSPELLRIPLESVIMEAKCHCPNEMAAEFLSQALQAPSMSAVLSALDELRLLGVLDKYESLTTLGKRIADFSTHPRLSVAMVVAAALRCLYPVLNCGAVLSSTQQPFLNVLNDKSGIRDTKERLCAETFNSTHRRNPNYYMSDHIAFGNLLAQYDNAANSKHESEYFINENNLHRSAMRTTMETRNLQAKMMITSRLVGQYEWYSFDSIANRNMNELDLMVAVLTHSFYPKIVRIIRGVVKNGYLYPNRVQAIDVPSNGRVRFASDSIVKAMSSGKQLSGPTQRGYESDDEDEDSPFSEEKRPTFITYLHSRIDQDSGFIVISDGSIVPPITLLLFGGSELAIHEIPQNNKDQGNNMMGQQQDSVHITMDRMGLLTFKVSRDDAQVIREWRRVWHTYLDWFIHTRDTSRPVESNDSIIAGTMNDFLDLTKKLYSNMN